MNFSRFKY